MKILQVTQFFKPSWEAGGVTRCAYELSKSLTKSGHDVTVYTTNQCYNKIDVEVNRKIIDEGLNIYYFNNHKKYWPFKNYPIEGFPVKIIFFARKYVKNFDIIHIHEHRNFLATVVSYYARKYNIPYIIQAHGSLSYDIGAGNFKKLFDILFGKKILENASGYFALNETEFKQYEKLNVNKNLIKIIPNGINLHDYYPLPDYGTFKKKFGIKVDENIILYLGRITKTKGIELLIDSFPDIISQIDNIKLVLAGPNGDYSKSLTDKLNDLKIKDRVLITGFISFEDKLAALVDSEVLVTPKYSGFPITFLEACACETPIIVTNSGDLLYWINNNVGLVLDYNKENFSEGIIKLFNEKESLLKYKINCKKIVKEEFEISKVTAMIEKIYATTIKETT